jgi:signal-transduction protein with cAMP-binding, CBS, and nucleotidyltransferase domain
MDFNTLLAIRDLMSKEIVTAPRTATVTGLAQAMAAKEITSIIIVTETDGAIAGIVTESDMVRKVLAEGRDGASLTAADVMNPDVHKVDGGSSIFEARNTMQQLKVKHLIVEEDGKPVGIVSSTALLGS